MPVLPAGRSFLVVAAAAVVLLVVGAGGAIGIGTTRHGHAGGAVTRTGGVVSPGAPMSTAPSAGGPPTTTTTMLGSQAATTTPTSSARGAVGALPVGGAGPAGTTTTTTVADHAPPATLAPSSSDEPATGTYDYATQGGYSFLDQSGTYPPTTTIVISRSGCGQADQWNSSPGDSTTITGCPVAGGVHIVSEATTTTYDGHTMTETFTCAADAFVPTTGAPGQTWRWSCQSSNGESSAQVVTLDGPATLTVGGTQVASEHVSIASTLSGPVTGHSQTEDWLDSVGLRLKETGDITASEYGVTFKDDYTLSLDSLRPA